MTDEPCPYCLADVRVSRWDSVVELAVQCRNCGAYWGAWWGPGRLFMTIVASFVVNILVLFVVTRPLRALMLVLMYATTVIALFGAPDLFREFSHTYGGEALPPTILTTIMFGPACLAIIEFIRHELLVRRPPVIPAGNELDIAIYHQKDRIRFHTCIAYFMAVLYALLAVVQHHRGELIIALLIVGFASSVNASGGRAFAALYLILGLALVSRYGSHFMIARGQPPPIAIPTFLVLQGVLILRDTFALAQLRRLRSLEIPSPPC